MVYGERLTLSGPSSALNQVTTGAVTGTASNFSISFPGGLVFEAGTKVALQSLSMTLSYTNINSAANNQTIGYRVTSGATSSTFITIPPGSYNVSDISNLLQATPAIGNNIQLSVNLNTIQCNVILAPGFSLDLTQGTLWQYLGFSSAQLLSNTTGANVTFTSTTVVNINTVNLILVHCNLIAGSGTFNNGIISDVIASFPPSVGPGQLQTYSPYQLIYQSMTSYGWQTINVYLTDQNNNPLDLNGQQVSVSLVFSK